MSHQVSPTEHRGYSIEREILPYILEFERVCNVKIDTHVRFSNMLMGEQMIAYCFPFINKLIHIDYEWWKKHSWDLRREQLVFHELGHCVLGRKHDSRMIERETVGYRPHSIMHPQIFADLSDYVIYKDSYIKELCKENN